MSNLGGAHAANMLDASLGTSTFVATTTPLHVRLIITANGTLTTPGSELSSGGGYTSGTGAPTITFTASAVQAAGSTNSAVAANQALSITSMPAVTGSGVVGVELWDSAATPIRKWWGPLTAAKTFNAGDTLSFPAASLTCAV